MGRKYVIPFLAVASPTAIFDFFEIVAATSKPFKLLEIKIGQQTEEGDAAAEMLAITIRRAAGSYTVGSGGTAIVVNELDSHDAAGAVTGKTMNTTVAVVGSGTLKLLPADAFNVMAGFHYLPTPECQETFHPAEALIVRCDEAPADAITFSGYIKIEEM